jgi:predicted glycosyltransferase involved in capsule biosynthesis
MENLSVVIRYIKKNLSANVYIYEIGEAQNPFFSKYIADSCYYRFIEDFDPIFHRTYYINQAVNEIRDSIVAIWDADVIVPFSQIKDAFTMVSNSVDFCYPYKNFFLDTTRELRRLFLKKENIDLLMKYRDFMTPLYTPNPVGGVFVVNKKKYIECGGEDENFYGWGMEDGERFLRWNSLGMSVHRINGPLFHLWHPRGVNSTIRTNDDSILKHREFFKSVRGQLWKS